MKSTVNTSTNSLSVSNFSARRFHRSQLKAPFWALLMVLALLLPCAAYGATITVTNLNDSGAGSLRAAIASASSGDTINFSGVIGTITLSTGTLTINNGGTITGPGANLLTISGANAVPVFTIYAPGTVTLSGLTIANGSNTANGGGIDHIYTAAALIVSDCAFIDNTTTAGGGGIANGGALTVQNTTFSGNSAAAGGGLFNNGGTSTVENSTFTGNSSSGGPGGNIFNNGTMTVASSTVTGSTNDGILNNGGQTITVTNSIVAGNVAGDCDGCGTQVANNLIGGTSALGPLQYNGGSTQTMMPLLGSPAIGAGSSGTPDVDQRGFARPISGSTDLGAVETNYLAVNTLNDSTDSGICGSGATCSLRDALGIASSNNSGDVIFQAGLTGTITLGGPAPTIYGNVNIQGPGADKLTISGNNSVPVFSIGPGVTAAISGLTIANGKASASSSNAGGGIENIASILTVENCTFSGNTASFGGGAILHGFGTLMVENSTFSNNSAGNTGIGGGIFNYTLLLVNNSTFSGNQAFRGGGTFNNNATSSMNNDTFFGNTAIIDGGGLFNGGGTLAITNSIVAGNTGGDCYNCTQNGPIVTGGNPGLSPLQLNGGTVPTMLPMPGSPAIQVGDPTQVPLGLATDERGFPRLTGGKLDVGAAQTNYTALQFVQQPADAAFGANITPAVTVEALETNTNLPGPNNTDAVNGVPVTLTFTGTGTLSGTLTQTTAGGVASFGDLSVNLTGTGDTLTTSVTVTPAGITPAQTLTTTSDPFNITLQPSIVSFNPPLPASVTYGVAPLTLKATTTSSGTVTGQTVSFQVDSGPATVSGNVLTITGAGTVVVEVDAAASGTYAAARATATITVRQAASTLTLTASANQLAPGAPLTLTATASSIAGVPTGTVAFLTASGPLGTATNLNSQGVATLTVTTLPPGSNAIAASYSGDTNFTGSGTQLSAPIVIGTPTFSIASSVPSLTIPHGQTGTATLTLTPAFGYTGTVNLSCGGLPVHSSCNFAPSSVTFNSSGSAVTVILTIATSVHGHARTGTVAQLTPLHPLENLPILPAIFFWLPGTGMALADNEKNKQRKDRKRSARMLLVVLLLALGAGMLSLVGCGGASFNTPAGQQAVTINAAGSGGISQSIQVNMTVQ